MEKNTHISFHCRVSFFQGNRFHRKWNGISLLLSPKSSFQSKGSVIGFRFSFFSLSFIHVCFLAGMFFCWFSELNQLFLESYEYHSRHKGSKTLWLEQEREGISFKFFYSLFLAGVLKQITFFF